MSKKRPRSPGSRNRKKKTRQTHTRIIFLPALLRECKRAGKSYKEVLLKFDSSTQKWTGSEEFSEATDKKINDGKPVSERRCLFTSKQLNDCPIDDFCLPKSDIIDAPERVRKYAERVAYLIKKGEIPVYLDNAPTDVAWYAFQMQDQYLDSYSLTFPQQVDALKLLASGELRCIEKGGERPPLANGRIGRLPIYNVFIPTLPRVRHALNERLGLGVAAYGRLLLNSSSTPEEKAWLAKVRSDFAQRYKDYTLIAAQITTTDEWCDHTNPVHDEVVAADYACRKSFFGSYTTAAKHFSELFGMSRLLVDKWRKDFTADFEQDWPSFIASNSKDLSTINKALNDNPVATKEMETTLRNCLNRTLAKYRELIKANDVAAQEKDLVDLPGGLK